MTAPTTPAAEDSLLEESLPRRQTDPVWIQDHFLGTGHDEKTRNATVTFVKRHGRAYAVTCRHAAVAAQNPRMAPGAKNPTLALHVGRAVLNFSYFTARGLSLHAMSPNTGAPEDIEIDVAIMPLDGAFWELLTANKNKVAIDLDNWREPKWAQIKYCLAAGYPDGHKKPIETDDGVRVASQLIVVCVEAAAPLSPQERLITLSSRLEKPHGYFFSGMSGGPIYGVEGYDKRDVEDDELFPIGIIFEGFPSTPAEAATRGPNSFLNDRDLFFRGLTLTPDRFDEWLAKSAAAENPAAAVKNPSS